MSVVKRHQGLAMAGLLLIILIWSYSWIILKPVLQYIGPFDITALRCLLGSVLLLIVMKLHGESMKPTPFIPTLLVALLQTCGMNGFSQWALINGGAGRMAMLTYTMPFWVILLAALFLGERMRRLQYCAIALALAGLLLILKPWTLSQSLFSSLLAILSGFFWAASAIVIKKSYLKYPNLNLLSLTAWQMLYGGIILSVIALSVDSKPIIWNTTLFATLAYCSILATAVAWSVWLFVLKYLPAGIAGISTLPIPILGVLFSWWLLGEVPDTLESIGIILIALALIVVSVHKHHNAESEIKIGINNNP